MIGTIFLPIAIGRINCKIPSSLALEVAAKAKTLIGAGTRYASTDPSRVEHELPAASGGFVLGGKP